MSETRSKTFMGEREAWRRVEMLRRAREIKCPSETIGKAVRRLRKGGER